MSELEDHPIAALFPLLDDAQATGLARDIEANGQQESIVLFEGKILDGRNRYRACIAAHATPITKEYQGTDPVGFVVSHNIHRRHLTTSQRAMIAADLANMKGGRPANTTSEDVVSQSSAAAKLHVSVPAVQRAAVVKKHGTPELQDAVRSGKLSVTAAAKIARLPARDHLEGVTVVDLAGAVMPPTKPSSPANGLQYGAMAISQLEKIQSQDTQRTEAFAKVRAWLDDQPK